MEARDTLKSTSWGSCVEALRDVTEDVFEQRVVVEDAKAACRSDKVVFSRINLKSEINVFF